MKEKLIEYVEKYYELKYMHDKLMDNYAKLDSEHNRLIYGIIKYILGNATELASWEYEAFEKMGIDEHVVDDTVEHILFQRETEGSHETKRPNG